MSRRVIYPRWKRKTVEMEALFEVCENPFNQKELPPLEITCLSNIQLSIASGFVVPSGNELFRIVKPKMI